MTKFDLRKYHQSQRQICFFVKDKGDLTLIPIFLKLWFILLQPIDSKPYSWGEKLPKNGSWTQLKNSDHYLCFADMKTEDLRDLARCTLCQ